MPVQQRSGRFDYGAVLAKRAKAIAEAMVDAQVMGTSQAEEAEPIILEALTSVSKESYKAGIRRGQAERAEAA